MATCEIETVVGDTDGGHPFDFAPCDQPVAQIVQWTSPGGMEIPLGVCAFHATVEL